MKPFDFVAIRVVGACSYISDSQNLGNILHDMPCKFLCVVCEELVTAPVLGDDMLFKGLGDRRGGFIRYCHCNWVACKHIFGGHNVHVALVGSWKGAHQVQRPSGSRVALQGVSRGHVGSLPCSPLLQTAMTSLDFDLHPIVESREVESYPHPAHRFAHPQMTSRCVRMSPVEGCRTQALR